MSIKETGGEFIESLEVPEEKIDSRLFGLAILRFLNMARNPTLNREITQGVHSKNITISSVSNPKLKMSLSDLSQDEPTNIRIDTNKKGKSIITCTIGNIDIALTGTASQAVIKISHDTAVLERIREFKDDPIGT